MAKGLIYAKIGASNIVEMGIGMYNLGNYAKSGSDAERTVVESANFIG